MPQKVVLTNLVATLDGKTDPGIQIRNDTTLKHLGLNHCNSKNLNILILS